ncbi:chorismate-binding protein [Desulfoprunum benzoelyticum]|uniref:Para-aminobenzoate synthetase/4-amino-4-deoxychorismate lyase n=1 Tax=Desulfoprunum benzoelyticum TaxID=1506996 RepID=A0A840UPM9_9BACT|nr:chorismate-binding protein [Desulfoprunum benzoelyticum]MBB5347595.1 para-aminobenzoate synthetase/4-amino-4-deoxychorismate lyase [Desulfoprunum benzoelyticum]MBM9531087.1 chorismate-binding protein [Desulfoprunum benzoelyticum]
MKRLAWEDLEGMFGFLADHKDFVFLDTSRPDRENRTSLLFTEPVARLRCHPGADAGQFLGIAEDWLKQGFWLAGWFDYDFGGLLEEKLAFDRGAAAAPAALADLGVYRKPYIYDHAAGRGDLPDGPRPATVPGWRVDGLQPNVDHAEYLQAIRRLRGYIAAGDTYQVNYTLKLLFAWSGSVEALYRDLRHSQTVPFGACIRRDEERILSFSPELFFRRDGRELTVRPMKGTSRRGRTAAEDRDLCLGLARDPKNRSENVMIVDLLRNDLARLMHRLGGGDVWVSSLFDVETYESLLQMTSTVKACPGGDRTGDGFGLYNLFHALFPCGSVTGAPKIRTMEIINELEKERRGVYTGAIGYLAPDGAAVFSVPIRTVVLRGTRGEMGIGSGIIIDSDPEQEWQECLLKGRFLSHCRPGFELLTTMLWQPGAGYRRLDRHLARLERSAAELCFSWSETEIRQRLERQAAAFAGHCMRVRLTLAKDGTIGIAAQPCEAPELLRLPASPEQPGPGLPEIDFSVHVIDGDSPWLRHKTTNRELYDREFRAGQEEGLYDRLFVNRRGEVTEGCISNVVVYADGRYRTPPLASGLLPGVMREQLLDDRERPTVEARLTPADVMAAEAIYLCNAVRGLVRVTLRRGVGKAVGSSS